MKWKNKGHEYDAEMDLLENYKGKCVIWGAGTYGYVFLKAFEKDFDILEFIDKNPQKQGDMFYGYPVISPQQFKEKYDGEMVIVSTGVTRSVYAFLEDMGLVRYKDFFHIDEVASLYSYRVKDKVFFNDATLWITQRCTLKCSFCNAFIPHYDHPCDYDIEFLKDTLKKYFRWVDELNVLALVGGDAMMHREFSTLLKWILDEYYPRQIKNIEIYSNAVIMPTGEILKLIRDNHVIYRFTDYHDMTGKQNIDKIERVFDENEIIYDHANFTSWFDCGYPQESNGITSEEGLIAFCNSCDRKTCHGIFGNKVLLCNMCNNASQIGYCDLLESDYFDLDPYDKTRRVELIEYYLGYSEKGYYNYCRKCNGGMNNNTHLIPAGEQKSLVERRM